MILALGFSHMAFDASAVTGEESCMGADEESCMGGDGERREWTESAGRKLLSWFLLSLMVLVLPFLPLWLAKRDFRIRALDAAAAVMIVPAGLKLAVEDESTPDGGFRVNERYRAAGSWESRSQSLSLTVTGDRHGYTVEVTGIHGYIKAPGGTGGESGGTGSGIAVDWQSLTAGARQWRQSGKWRRSTLPFPCNL